MEAKSNDVLSEAVLSTAGVPNPWSADLTGSLKYVNVDNNCTVF